MLRRGSRINTDRFPERAPKGDLGACSPRESVPGFLSHSDWILANSILLGLKALQIGGLVLLSISTWRVFLILKLIYCENSDRFLLNGANRWRSAPEFIVCALSIRLLWQLKVQINRIGQWIGKGSCRFFKIFLTKLVSSILRTVKLVYSPTCFL